jgi:hypothetical protein
MDGGWQEGQDEAPGEVAVHHKECPVDDLVVQRAVRLQHEDLAPQVVPVPAATGGRGGGISPRRIAILYHSS